ncbi:sigma-70 family RNA polymerase sigma factor [Sporosarcina thermotolerans]|uniref:Sigma-70 family RNA polymerase sigma factor n=1 Tax=Sporosarcina thermotolerans TaxID=633404 RepID=A0AAW9AHK4_9BACL|nr:sigma-70 family RNA polymerase sigma factor [Sporosarcina thermotolerans]MDW0118698.1 sigma-70 family RNA polymerase sigma factor [Sporosarcina thermotolerans]WHT48657.1 sigma-70 family RNA polymerase sigma factor [Sporosarcina thermotolerans]
MTGTNELKELMFQYTEYLIRLAYYYVKDLQAAEDIVQEVFIKFYNNQHKYEEQGEVKAFLTKMTVNKSKDYLKSWAYRKMQLVDKFFPSETTKGSDDLVRKDEETIIGEAILQLPLKQREVLIYFYFHEMTIVAIASLLAIPESTVKTRLRRGRELLRNQLKGIEWEVLLNG